MGDHASEQELGAIAGDYYKLDDMHTMGEVPELRVPKHPRRASRWNRLLDARRVGAERLRLVES